MVVVPETMQAVAVVATVHTEALAAVIGKAVDHLARLSHNDGHQRRNDRQHHGHQHHYQRWQSHSHVPSA